MHWQNDIRFKDMKKWICDSPKISTPFVCMYMRVHTCLELCNKQVVTKIAWYYLLGVV